MTPVFGRAVDLARRESTWAWLVVAGFALVVLIPQNRVVGWEPGYNELQPGHHGWVSSHTLAIISHASAENRYVGYALAIADRQGKVDYDYFDRTPVFFSTGMHAVLSFWSRLSTKVYLARQAMNGIFLLTVLVAWQVLRLLTGRTLPALAASILAVSSRYLLFYKDMVHFDQPALLGTMLVTYGIALHSIAGRRKWAYALAFLGVSLGGQAFAPLAAAGVWAALEIVRELRDGAHGWAARLRRVWALDSPRVLAVGVAWAAVNLFYNIQAEAALRGVPPAQTSIVQSAFSRLGLSVEFNASYSRLLEWDYFTSDQVIRIVRWVLPIWNYEGSVAISLLAILAILAVIVVHGRRADSPRRMLLAVLAVSGGLWLFVMRNLSAFHDYTAMFYLGLALAFYASVTSFLRLPRAGWVAVTLLSLALFAERNLRTQAFHTAIGAPTNAYTHDFMNIAAALPSPGLFIHYANGVPDAPYSPGFYLPADVIAPIDVADYVISSDPDFLPGNLTPQNARLYFFPAGGD